MIGAAIPVGDDWTVTPKVGPSYSYSRRKLTRSTTFDFASPIPSQPLPNLRLSNTDRLSTHYAGVLAGVGLSRPLSNKWGLSLNLEGGPARYWGEHATQSGSEIVGVASLPMGGSTTSYDGSARLGRAGITFTRSHRPGATLSLGLFANYVSDMPSLTATSTGLASPSVAAGGGAGNFAGTGQTAFTTSVTTDDMITYGAAVTMVLSF